MFNLEDYVSHKHSGYTGKVIGFGHRIVDGTYQPTIRVNVAHSLSANRLIVVEDLVSLWEQMESNLKKNSSIDQ